MKILLKNDERGGVLFVPDASFEQSQWLGANGFWFYGKRSKAKTASTLQALGIKLNTRWLPAAKADAIAHLVGTEGLDWSEEALAVVQPKADAQAASWAQDADISIPAPDGLAYRPYQRAGVAFALAAFKRGQRGVLIGDEMGLGKTMQAIGTMVIAQPRRILVACPASLRINWKREIEKWWPEAGDCHVINGDDSIPAGSRVVIVNYDKVVGSKRRAVAIRAALMGAGFDLVVLDEAHLLKNPKAQRTGFFLGKFKRDTQTDPGLIDQAERVLLLTGTPIQNKVRESVTLLRAAGAFEHGTFDSEGQYLFRYCGPQKVKAGRRTVTTFDGSTNLPELNSKLRSGGIMVRRLKADVATELPPKLRSVVALANPVDDLIVSLDLARRIEQVGGDTEGFGSNVDALLREVVGFQEISRIRAALAAAKADAVVEHVQTLLESEDKVIVFGHHKVLLNALDAAFTGCSVRIDGSVGLADRQVAVDRFQGDSDVRVAILSTHAAGVGITLTAASCVVFGEADWNPSWCIQAEDRAHRIGQDADLVTVQYLVLDETLDAHVIRTMVAKMEIADAALDHKRVATPPPAAPKAPAPGESRGARDVTICPRKGPSMTVTLTADRIEAIATALLELAGACDGARARDDVGFNGRDAGSDFVQSLVQTARSERGLSDKQAAWALKVITTYKNTQVAHLAPRLWPQA
jgi:SWI/SNF-related matrix-associated actin-dependent regulator 1 of chromatin subfamily A